MISKPLVSVVITTFERPSLLERAIESVMAQTYENIEVVVSDDCSSDNTRSLVNKLARNSKFPIIYRCNDINSGACYTRNQGILIANGVYIAGLDDDDEFTKDRVQVLLSAYSDDYSFVCSNTIVLEKNSEFKMYKYPLSKHISLEDALWENVIGTQVLVERERIVSIGGFDLSLPSSQDADMWIRLIESYGSALRLKQSTYLLHTEHDKPRISSSTNKLKGLKMYYEKHKHLMTPSQRKYNELKFLLWEGASFISMKCIRKLDLVNMFYMVKRQFLR
ncbi:glycosyltransferase [Vibrio lentus]|nr:glycosyltransferase [Vibrio lentus]PMI69452.1 hypothetical protein BCU43_24515 [Vibrio lentus]